MTTMAAMLGAVLGFLSGLSVIIGLSSAGVWKNTCESFGGRVCNGWGVCDRFGQCLCDVRFSGPACQYTLCPGYNQAAGTVCNGLGTCSSPFMQGIPDACNSAVLRGGWNTPECAAAVAAIKAAPFNITTAVGIPQCSLCQPPTFGDDCSGNMCPENTEFQVCSGNGLANVGYTSNSSGNAGCQCRQILQMLSPTVLSNFSEAALAVIATSLTEVYSKGYCGRVEFSSVYPDAFYVHRDQPVALCFCQSGWFGIDCELGKCPQVNGQICANAGHSSFGQGLLANTTSPDSPNCQAVCQTGFTSCNGVCDVDCANPLYCPASAPWRCPDQSCQPTPTGPCALFSMFGYLDDLSLARDRYYYSAPGTVWLNSPLVFYSFSGVGQLQYANGTVIASSDGSGAVFGIVQRNYPDLQDWVNTGLVVQWAANPDSQGDITIYPAPDVVPSGPMRLLSAYGQVVVDYIGRSNTFGSFNASTTPNGTFVIVEFPPYGYALPGGGNATTLADCVNVLSACIWTWDGSGIGRLCSSPAACDQLPVVTTVRENLIVRQRTFLNDYIGRVWQLWAYMPPLFYPVVLVGNLTEVELISTGNLSMACACPVISGFSGVNQSVQNAGYLADATRTTPTDFAVVPYTLQGDDTPVRAQIVQVVALGAIVEAPGYPNFFVPTAGLHYLTPAEFAGGVPTCDARVFPSRCQSGVCTTLSVRNTTELRSCQCTGIYGGQWVCADCQCTCDASSCSCANAPLAFSTSLFAEIQALASCLCLFDPEVPHQLVTYGANETNGTWFFAGQNSSLLEIDVPGGCFEVNTTLANFTLFCEGNATILVPGPLAFSADPFQVMAPLQPVAYWSPEGGIPVFRAANISVLASSNEAAAGQTTNLNRTWWQATDAGKSFLQLDFGRPFYLTGVALALYTAGAPYTGGALPVRLLLQAWDGAQWVFVAQIVSDVVQAWDARVFPVTGGPYSRLRLDSPIPMAVRYILPFTSQDCQCNATAVGGSRSDLVVPGPCVGNNLCNRAGNGACNDLRYEAYLLGLQPSLQKVLGVPINLVTLYQQIYVGFVPTYFVNGYLPGLFALWNTSLVPFSQVGLCGYGTLCVRYNSTGYFPGPDITNGSGPFQLNSQQAILQPYSYQLLYGIENVTCPTGTDMTDCGCSARLTALPVPGLSCNTTNFLSNFPSVTLYALQVPFPIVNITLDCPFRCPLATCPDGSCADLPELCPRPTYNCPGNGCLCSANDECYCVCQKGYGGTRCEFAVCKPGSIDPYEQCWCGSIGPLRAEPPQLDYYQNYSTAELIALNYRAHLQNGSNDIAMRFLQYSTAPFGIIVDPIRESPGGPINSACPYARKGPRGQYLLYQDCVNQQNQFGQVLSWNSFPDYNGNLIPCIWTSPFEFDDFPVKCPNNRQCVDNLQKCARLDVSDPLCHGKGTCRADGTCDFTATGWETFYLTQYYSQQIAVPYDYADPTLWGVPNNNWRDFYQWWGAYPNCSSSLQDCSVMGCYAGSLAFNFLDAHVKCPANTAGFGFCGANQQACVGNQVTPLIPCSGNGIIRKRAYRDELYCQCGAPISPLVNDTSVVKDATELVPNGWGGLTCRTYECDQNPQLLRFDIINVLTGKPFVNSQNQQLPGLWQGACGAPIGPCPEDAGLWQNCCPGMTQWELCPFVPCIYGAQPLCVPAQDCIPSGGTPKVGHCNCHGAALKDGTCLCNANENTGIGYHADLTRFSYQGCYAADQCPLSDFTGTPCHSMPACDFTNAVTLPNHPFWTQQWPTFLLLAGLAVSNTSLINAIDPNPNHQTSLRVQGLIDLALQFELENASFIGCIDVFPNENCSTVKPVAMIHPSDCGYVYPYGKGFNSPFYITPVNITYDGVNEPLLNDSKFFGTNESLVEGVDYVILNSSTTIVVNFDQPYFVTFVRLNLWQQTGNARVNITFPDGSICQPPVSVMQGPTFQWQGADAGAAIQCTTLYQNFDFRGTPSLVSQYQANCGDPAATQCLNWELSTCAALGRIVPTAGNYYPGCDSPICCTINIARSTGYFASIIVQMLPPTTGGEVFSAWLDEVQIYGSAATVLPLPANLVQLINTTIQSFSGPICQDEKFMAFASRNDTLNLQDKQFFELSKKEQAGFWNSSICQQYGGWPATNTDGSQNADLIAPYCRTGECWVAAKDRDDVPDPALKDFILPACTAQGCYTPNPTPFNIDPAAVLPDNAAQYQTATPTTSPWLNLLRGSPSNAVFDITSDNGACTISFYTIPDCNQPQPQPADFPFPKLPAPCFLDIGAGILNYHPTAECDGTSYPLWTGPVAELTLSFANGYTSQVLSGANFFDTSAIISQSITPLTDYPDSTTGRIGGTMFYTGVVLDNQPCGTPNNDCASSRVIPIQSTSIGVTGSCSIFAVTDNIAVPETLTNFLVPGAPQVTSTWTSPPNSGQSWWNLALTSTGWPQPTRCFNMKQSNNYRTEQIGLVLSVPIFNLYVHLRSPLSPADAGAHDSMVMSLTQYPFMCSNVEIAVISQVAADPDQYSFFTNAQQTWAPGTSLPPIAQAVTFPPYYRTPQPSRLSVSFTSFTYFEVVTDFSGTFIPCTLPACPTCELPQTPSYQWDQYVFDPNTNFFQTVFAPPNPPGAPQQLGAPTIHVNWVNGAGVAGLPWTPLQALRSYDSFAYTNLSCNLVKADYRAKWDLDYCILVSYQSGLSQYKTDVCSQFHNMLCIRDTGKYTIQSGRQGDVCGSNARVGGLAQPQFTCFDQFPLINDPYASMVYQYWLQDRLLELVQSNNTDYAASVAYVLSLPISIILAVPGWIAAMQGGLSTRSGSLSPAGTLSSLNWINANLNGIFGFTCTGRPCDVETGICRRWCAVSAEYCQPNGPQYDGPLMANSQKPAFLQQLANTTDFTTTAACGDVIYVTNYPVTTNVGPGNFPQFMRLLSILDNALKVQLMKTSSPLFNLAQTYHQFVVNQTNWLSGTITVNPCTICQPYVVFWISPGSVYQIPQKYVVANLSLRALTNKYAFSFVVPNDGTNYNSLGLDFGGMIPTYVITISNVVATSNTSIQACQSSTFNSNPWYEAPSSIPSPVEDNFCNFGSQQTDCPVGQCCCAKSWAGPKCDWPALPLLAAPDRTLIKAACGGFGTDGVALGVDGSLIQVTNSFGAYKDGNFPQCKCLDIAKRIRTLFRPDSAFANEFVFRYDVPFGEPEFAQYNVSTPTNQVIDYCGGFGSTLPSWITAQDIINFLDIWRGLPVVMDFTQPVSAFPFWGWQQAATPVNISDPVATTPCPVGNLCQAVNYNNLAYGADGAFTDGVLDVVAGTIASIAFVLNSFTGTSWSIVIWPAQPSQGISMTGCAGPASSATTTTLTCTVNTNVVVLNFTTGSLSINEVQVFADGARVYSGY